MGGAEETLKDRGKVEAAVEAPLERREVAGEVLYAHPTADAEQAALEVAQDGVHPGEARGFGRPPRATFVYIWAWLLVALRPLPRTLPASGFAA